MTYLLPCINCTKPFGFGLQDLGRGRVPLVLSCGCSMCVDCVNLEQRRRKRSVMCPRCNKPTKLGSGKANEQLAPNLYTLGLLTAESMELISVPKDITVAANSLERCLTDAAALPNSNDYEIALTHKLFCDECTKSASVHCSKCGGMYCSDCFEIVHSRSKSMRTHHSTPLSLALATPSDCIKHSDSQHTHYCNTDKVAVCPDCLLGDHKDHEIVKLHDAASVYREDISRLMESANATLSRMTQSEKALSDQLQSLSEKLMSRTKDIKGGFALLHADLQTQEANVLADLNKAVSLYGTALHSAKRVIQSHRQGLSSTIRESTEALANDYLILKSGDDIIAKLSNVHHLPQNLDQGSYEPIKFSMSSKEVVKAGYLTYNQEYTGPAILSQEGLVEQKYLDDMKKGFGNLGTRPHSSHSASPNPLLQVATDERSRSVTPILGDLEKTTSQIFLEVTNGHSSRASRSSTPLAQFSTGSARSSRASTPGPILMDTHDTCDVTVTHIKTVNEFYVQESQHWDKIAALMAQVEEHCNSTTECYTEEQLRIGLNCASKFQDGKWYRVSVTRYLGNNRVEVYAVDYGFSEEVDLSSVKPLPESLRSHPPLCSECSLANVSPYVPRVYGGTTWSKKAESIFKSVAISDSLKMKIHDWSSSGKLLIDLLFPIEEGFTSLSRYLVTEGVASRGSRRVKQDDIPPPVTLGLSDTRDVVVPYVVNPHDFFVHIATQEKEALEFIDKVQSAFTASQLLPIGTPRKGMLCLALYTDDGEWYRAKVIDVCADGVHVIFVDFGNDCTVPTVYPLPPDLRTTPVQAIHCSLYNIEPLEGNDQWPKTVCDSVNKCMVDGVWSMTVRDSAEGVIGGGSIDNPLLVEMTEKGRDITLNDLLVSSGNARYKFRVEDDMSTIVDSMEPMLENSQSQRTLSHPTRGNPPETHEPPHPHRSPVQGMGTRAVLQSTVFLSPQRGRGSRSSSQPSVRPPSRQGRGSRASSQPLTRLGSASHDGSPQPSSRQLRANPCAYHSGCAKGISLKGQGHLCIHSCPQIPRVGTIAQCKVMCVTTHQSFYVVFPDSTYDQITQQLESVSRSNDPPRDLECGEACLALFQKDGKFYRAIVTEKKSKKYVSILYVDYGNTKKVKVTDIQSIPDALLSAPPQAVKCKLRGTEKLSTATTSQQFYQLVTTTELSAKIHDITDDGMGVVVSLSKNDIGDIGEALLKASQYTPFDLSNLPSGSFVIQVTFVEDNIVYGHIITKERKDAIEQVVLAVEEMCANASPVGTVDNLSIMESCCARFSQDKSWNRVIIKEVDKAHDNVAVYFIDYGNTDVVSSRDIIKDVICVDIPALAVAIKVNKTNQVCLDGCYTVELLPGISDPPYATLQQLY